MAEQERVLVIDDEDSCRTLLAEWLRSCGYHCEEANNGSEGLNRALDQEWNLILSDIIMPGLSGVELVRMVKNFKSSTPVIMISAVRNLDTIKSAFREGAYDCIFKPFDLNELEISIARALEKSRLARENERHQQLLEQRVTEQAERIRSLSLGAIIALARALEAKDQYTSGHSQRVAEYSAMIAQQMGLDDYTCEQVRIAGQLHDIGKIGLRESILNKPGRLTDEEYNLVRQHPVIGSEILRPVINDVCVLHGVKHHHECFDGRGYPDGLVGEEIPLPARILSVADTYDAITTNRAYRGARDYEAAHNELVRCAGTQFDPAVVNAFIEIPKVKIAEVMQRIPPVAQWSVDLDNTFSQFLAVDTLAKETFIPYLTAI
ncbi:MAG: HD domain-containing phosphohydrolase [Acidobacteriota bacterium]